MLTPELKSQLSNYLKRLRRPVQITAWLDESGASETMRALLGDVAGASPLVRVSFSGEAADRTPSFGVGALDEEPRVRFAGLPLGHELNSLVLALLHVGGHPPKERPELLEQVRGLRGRFELETYFSAACQSCPDVVQALNTMAALNPGVRHVAIDGALFREEATRRGVMAVPGVYLDGEPFAQGRMELEELLARIDRGSAERRARELNDRETFDTLIVGGGPAGAAAAIYAARKGISTGVVTERFGGQVLDTQAIENFVSVPETDGPRFAAALEAHVRSYPVDVMRHQRARRLVPGETIRVELESGATLRARSVVLAPGARWRSMNVPGEELYRTRGVTYCPHCDGPLFAGKRVAVIGGGNSGVEAAVDLAGVAAQVTLIEFLDVLKADAVLQRKLLSLPNVRVVTGARTTEVLGDGEKMTGLAFEERATGELRRLELEGIFVQIGLLPNTDWLEGTVELSPQREIVVDAKGRTSVPGVFGAGDATTVPFKQIVIATGEGAKAALAAFEHLIRSSTPVAPESAAVAAG